MRFPEENEHSSVLSLSLSLLGQEVGDRVKGMAGSVGENRQLLMLNNKWVNQH